MCHRRAAVPARPTNRSLLTPTRGTRASDCERETTRVRVPRLRHPTGRSYPHLALHAPVTRSSRIAHPGAAAGTGLPAGAAVADAGSDAGFPVACPLDSRPAAAGLVAVHPSRGVADLCVVGLRRYRAGVCSGAVRGLATAACQRGRIRLGGCRGVAAAALAGRAGTAGRLSGDRPVRVAGLCAAADRLCMVAGAAVRRRAAGHGAGCAAHPGVVQQCQLSVDRAPHRQSGAHRAAPGAPAWVAVAAGDHRPSPCSAGSALSGA